MITDLSSSFLEDEQFPYELLINSFHLKVYSVVSIKRTGGNKRTEWAEFFSFITYLYEKQVQGGAKTSNLLSDPVLY